MSKTDREATQEHVIMNAVMGYCGELLTPSKVEQLVREICSEMHEGACAWAFKEHHDDATLSKARVD